MKIDLTELLQKVGRETDIEDTLDPAKISSEQDNLKLVVPVKVDLHLTNVGGSVFVRGTIKTELELECSRCLKPYNLPVTAQIEEEYSLSMPEKTGKDVELHEEDFVYPIEKDNSINLSETIRQNLLLTIPIKTLCSANCPGINPPRAEKGE